MFGQLQISKVEPLVNKWIENKGYCKADMTIKDVAAEMVQDHHRDDSIQIQKRKF